MSAITPALLLARLDAVGQSLRDSGHALALLALGSAGPDTHRLDEHSDLDFFAIVEPGYKSHYIDALDWLAAAHPIVWHYRNTPDGCKALMADGVFCEFAVFEPPELEQIPFAPGRIVWRRPDVDPAIAVPRRPLPERRTPDETWLVGEALGNLLVGLLRWRRGERLAGARLVQVEAVDRLIDLDALRCGGERGEVDPFNPERRVEQRHPGLNAELPALMPGYEQTPRAALAVLDALAKRGASLDPTVTARIRSLAGEAGP